MSAATTRRRPKPSASQTVTETKAQHAERLRGYSDTFLMCRDLRHAWEPSGLWREGGRVRRRLTCSRCHTQRVDCWTRFGQREQPKYIYPDDYQMKGSTYDTTEIRVEVMHRLSVFSNEQTMIQSMLAPKRNRPLRARKSA